ncbi:DUF5004 domain-containing protein [uncultured Kriegella sp.]|uniref:DUF5004 domain-containing protein n=1 Tax=uncultured Kriegella sp. TaxID=1798910 RepID=UPI0030D6FA9E|tara:strand:- start:105165 stop:105680 length:516 start_codon:yes stop_codon:yes gene_type:complete
MKKFQTILFSLITAVTFVGCNSDNGDTNCVEDFTGALASSEEAFVGTWTLTAITAEQAVDITDDNEDNASEDIYAQYEACEKDAAYTFESGRIYNFVQGQNATGCTNKATLSGTWKLSGQTLSLTGSCTVQNLTLQFDSEFSEFSSTSIINILDVTGNTIQTNVTFTYSKS